jgi:hypothetical protein
MRSSTYTSFATVLPALKDWAGTFAAGFSPDLVVITQYLSAQVPGHLVEQIQRHYKASAPKPKMVIHQRVVAVEMPPG